MKTKLINYRVFSLAAIVLTLAVVISLAIAAKEADQSTHEGS